MKGIVFTEYLDMVEEKFGLAITDQMLEEARTSTNGAFTSVGNYPCEDLVNMVVELSKITKMDIPDLIQTFGKYFFTRLYALHPAFMDAENDLFSFLETIDQHIHVEVQKIYPKAQLPKFTHVRKSENELELTYESPRPLGDFAQGLIFGSADHFKTAIEVSKKDLSTPGQSKIAFTIIRNV